MRIVTLGGGTGQGQLLRGLARLRHDLAGIVGVTDNGGHTGHLRTLYGIPAVGDVRNCLLALAGKDDFAKSLRFRFSGGELDGASVGNLVLAAMTLSMGSISAATAELSKRLGVTTRVLPVSDGASQICGEIDSGETIRGEWDLIQRKKGTAIRRLFHDPPLTATAACVTALRKADLVVLAPGSLRTGIISILLATGVKEALQKRRVVQVLNILTQPGQTDRFTAKEHVDEITRYLGRPPDIVLANTARPAEWAAGEGHFVEPEGVEAIKADLLESIDTSKLESYRPARFISGPHIVRHDPNKLAKAISKLTSTRRRS